MAYEYDFVVIGSEFVFAESKQKEYREIIEERARNGWRFIQIFAPSARSFTGGMRYFELIFEREVK